MGLHYPKNCISARLHDDYYENILNYLPIKIMIEFYDIQHLANKKFTNSLEYLHVPLFDDSEESWDNYEEIFDQCSSLKAIELTYRGLDIIPNLTNNNPRLKEV